MTKIGIYSGTFDPVHVGHLEFAKQALTECGLEKVFFLVEPRPRRKQGVKAVEHRQKMIQLALKDKDNFGDIVLGQERFTVTDTLPLLQSRFKGAKLYFLMGDDMLAHFTSSQWPHIGEFLQAVHLIIGVRTGSTKSVEEHIRLVEKTFAVKVSYTAFATAVSLHSSTRIRTQLRAGQRPEEITKEVYNYIKKHKLYASTEGS